ncbi:MAG: hypothetical protein AB1529_05550 [Candidatus Micrarchaeota archaeon]
MADMSEEEVVKKANEDANNVKCSFCGNEAYCEPCKNEPAKMAGFEHMCFECHQRMGQVPENVRDKTHLCIPPEKLQENFERFMNDVTQRAFDDLWNAEKKKLKEMSRQELAQASFFEGASFMFHLMQRMSQQPAAGPQPPVSGNREPETGETKPGNSPPRAEGERSEQKRETAE